MIRWMVIVTMMIGASLSAQSNIEAEFLKQRPALECYQGPVPDISYGRRMTVYVGAHGVRKIECAGEAGESSTLLEWYFDRAGLVLVTQRVYVSVDESGRLLNHPVLESEKRYWLKGDGSMETSAQKKKELRREARMLIQHFSANAAAFATAGD